MYKPAYTNTHALIIGINAYTHVSPLEYARNDAEAVADTLCTAMSFPKENVALLLDESATREAILSNFLRFSQADISEDDRILVFFAGHGFTCTGRRGEVGYLIPVDGNPDRLETLLRWDDLTRNADLIRAKHLLFIMDACYGGLVLTRAPGPGSMRFLKDMLQRYARQVITAGKADEVVADAGGPLPDHSIFTGHFIRALEGAAATTDGIITANGVMAYVYERVSKDINSRQTPHFGFLDGDGDFIFHAPILAALTGAEETGKDVLIETPQISLVASGSSETVSTIELMKEYIADPRYRIKLDEMITIELRRVLSETSDSRFPTETADVSVEEFAARLKRYEGITATLRSMVSLLAYWCTDDHLPLIRKAVSRLANNDKRGGGKVVWLALRWYPSMLLMYSSGIAAIAAGNYKSLFEILLTKIGSHYSGEKSEEAVLAVMDGDLELQRTNVWKGLPDHERNYVPRSEYLFKMLQPESDDLLFLGRSYETFFDRFETILALVYADLRSSTTGVWGPPGRFAWKYSRSSSRETPYSQLIQEAETDKDEWPPLKAGFFQGSFTRFMEIATAYGQQLQGLHWW